MVIGSRSWTEYYNQDIVKFDSVVSSVGNFTLDNRKIIIGTGIHKVLITASIYLNKRAIDYGYVQLEKNGTKVRQFVTDLNSYSCATLPCYILEVEEGDELRIKTLGDLYLDESQSYMTIVKIG